MRTTTGMVGAMVLAAGMGPAQAEDDTRLNGLWKLVSYEVEVRQNGEKLPVMGKQPTGYAYVTPEKRIFFILTGEGRKPA